ncbi:MAG: hypothetical protein LBK60_12850 [Verrucomicrobiales bacterium]|jgi:Ca-activated chloride channel family protein|nr:hypothetical protein [Verrucomicrobiales bacterium]
MTDLLAMKAEEFFRNWRLALTVMSLGAAWSAAPGAPLLDARAQKEYRKQADKFLQKLQQHPDDSILRYNLGTANYQLGHYEAAADDFQKSLSADDVKLQNFAYYNLGNAWYRRGELMEKTEPEKTRDLWQQAAQAYQGALQLDADDAQAKQNLEFVQKRLNELPPPQQNQDEQQQDDQKDGQNDDQQQQQQQNSPDQKQNQQDQNGQGQQQQQQSSGADGDQQKKQSADGDKHQQKQNQQPQQKPGADGDQKKDADQRQSQSGGADGGKKQGDGQRQAQPAKPGELTKEQAGAALDALKGEERPYNMALPNYRSANPQARGKDW